MKVNTIKLVTGTVLCGMIIESEIDLLISGFITTRESDGTIRYLNPQHILYIIPEDKGEPFTVQF